MAANIPSLIGGAIGGAIGGPVGSFVGQTVARAASYVVPFANWTPALFLPYRRSIGGIYAQITVDEQHTDEVQITDHPVEAGAPISDHAFARPQQVAITAGWSKATAFDLSAESGVYGLLLALQTSFMPFDIYTGKRHYKNMLIERLAVTTDQHNEFTLLAQIVCRQVIIVNTQTTKVDGVADQSADQTEPEKSATPSEKGEQATDKPSDVQQGSVGETTKINDPGGSVRTEKGVSFDDTPADYQIGPSGTPGAFSGQEGRVIPIAPAQPSSANWIEPPPAASPATIMSP